MKTRLQNLVSGAEDVSLNVGYLLLNMPFVEAAVHEAEMRLEVSRALGDQLSPLERLAITVLGLAEEAQDEMRRAN